MAEAAREGGREARGGDARPNRGREEEKGGGVEVKEETEVNNRNGKLFPPPPPKLSLSPLPTSASDSPPSLSAPLWPKGNNRQKGGGGRGPRESSRADNWRGEKTFPVLLAADSSAQSKRGKTPKEITPVTVLVKTVMMDFFFTKVAWDEELSFVRKGASPLLESEERMR